MDWLKGKSQPETIDFPRFSHEIWGYLENVPLNQPSSLEDHRSLWRGAKLHRTALPAQRTAGHVAAPRAHDPMDGWESIEISSFMLETTYETHELAYLNSLNGMRDLKNHLKIGLAFEWDDHWS